MTRRLNIYQYNSKMSLRRKAASRRTSETGSVKASLYAYPDRDLEKDYIIWNSINGIKVGQCRHENTRQLVIVQEVKRISVSQFSRVLRIFHENIASPIFLYKSHIIYEFVDLDIVDVLPLSQPEIANAMAQAMSAVYAALEETLTFRIDTVRISHLGVVKLSKIVVTYTPTIYYNRTLTQISPRLEFRGLC